jgi:hypothetical protein
MALPDYLILQWTTLVDLPVRMHLLPLLKISRTLPGTILVFVHSFLRHSGDTKVTLRARSATAKIMFSRRFPAALPGSLTV